MALFTYQDGLHMWKILRPCLVSPESPKRGGTWTCLPVSRDRDMQSQLRRKVSCITIHGLKTITLDYYITLQDHYRAKNKNITVEYCWVVCLAFVHSMSPIFSVIFIFGIL